MPRVVHQDAELRIDQYMLEGIDTSAGPIMRVGTVADIFFAKSIPWMRKHDTRLNDGSDRRYTLSDVEQFAHSMRTRDKLDSAELRKVLRTVRAVALSWGYLE